MAKFCSFFRTTSNLKYAVGTFFQKNKWLILFLCVVMLTGVLTGVFVAIKSGITLSTLQDYNLSICDSCGALTFASVWERYWSILVVMLVCFVASLSVFFMPLGVVVIAYRSYLVGFNSALMFCLFGVSGAITSVLVVVPCQILIVLALIIFFTMLINAQDAKKRYGQNGGKIKIIFVFLILTFLLCLVESVLLVVFSASTILVI